MATSGLCEVRSRSDVSLGGEPLRTAEQDVDIITALPGSGEEAFSGPRGKIELHGGWDYSLPDEQLHCQGVRRTSVRFRDDSWVGLCDSSPGAWPCQLYDGYIPKPPSPRCPLARWQGRRSRGRTPGGRASVAAGPVRLRLKRRIDPPQQSGHSPMAKIPGALRKAKCTELLRPPLIENTRRASVGRRKALLTSRSPANLLREIQNPEARGVAAASGPFLPLSGRRGEIPICRLLPASAQSRTFNE
jgi:hypothetical protein